jgi:plasmid stabilization system protein ParE
MKVVIEDEALDDLERIHAWIARDNVPAADAAIARIFDQIDQLGRLPLLGHRGRARGTLEWVVTASSHVIVYALDVRRDELQIIGVFRGSQLVRRP